MTTQPIGLSSDLAPRQVMRAVIGQFDIAVWRSVSGVVSAWENRCPHRGMRLSHGFVRGESLACAYHGWHYDCEGYCHYIPAHPELTPPRTVQPTIYSVLERDGLIWSYPDGDVNPVTLPGDTDAVRSITLQCDLDTALKTLSGHKDTAKVSTLAESPRVLSVDIEGISDGVIIAFQQTAVPAPNDQQSVPVQPVIAHTLVAAGTVPARRVAVSRWLESIRRQAEQDVSVTSA